jgi:hypothetical protein
MDARLAIACGKAAGQRQQQLDMHLEAEGRTANRAADLDFHQKLMQMGAKPVVNGLVEDQADMSAAGVSGMPSTVSIVRPADKSRVTTFSDRTGDKVSYELPTYSQQLLNRFDCQAKQFPKAVF